MCAPDPQSLLFVGIDVAYQTADVAWLRSGQVLSTVFTVPRTPQGFATLRARLAATAVPPTQTLVVLAATGSYWCRLPATSIRPTIPSRSEVRRIGAHYSHQPRAGPLLCQSPPACAETDALDAQLLAQFSAQMHPVPWTVPRLCTMRTVGLFAWLLKAQAK
jgi:hypothetical protein